MISQSSSEAESRKARQSGCAIHPKNVTLVKRCAGRIVI